MPAESIDISSDFTSTGDFKLFKPNKYAVLTTKAWKKTMFRVGR